MCQTIPLIFSAVVAMALLIVSEAQADSTGLNDMQQQEILSPEDLASIEHAKQGRIGAAIESVRPLAGDPAEKSFNLAFLLFAWRRQLAKDDITPMPPVDWEMDWFRCSAVLAKSGEDGGFSASFLAEYYENDYIGEREISGERWPAVPGPGRSPELASCWSAAADGSANPQECIARERSLREKRKLPAFTCPPSEPTKANIAKYPAVKLVD